MSPAMIALLLATVLAAPASALSCREDRPRAEARSRELQRLVAKDQADRQDNALDPGTIERDMIRRKRVAEIFGEGCFETAADFAAGALVFQHGDVPEHFLQTFLWAKRAVELGHEKNRRLMALAVDRYLVNTGRKQLFASQASRRMDEPCWCLQPVEKTFPAELRLAYMGETLADKFKWVVAMNAKAACPAENTCAATPALTDSPAGTVPGLW